MEVKILWADDEIDLLKPHILFLENKGYSVDTINNGLDAVEKSKDNNYDIIFLDENMPGISGLEALIQIKENKPFVPIVMITKSEEEHIMEEAIGSKIADYLIKPVNPNQILLTLKKNLDHRKLVSQKTNSTYQQEFRQLGMALHNNMTIDEWSDLFKKLVYWELELEKIEDAGMCEILNMQKKEANSLFVKFIENNYQDWLSGEEEGPQMIHTLIKDKVIPEVDKEKVALVVIDNLRYDQWEMLKPILMKYFKIENEEIIYSILPTATHYARNALFSGLMPSEIQKLHPDFWVSEEDERGKNLFEKELLQTNLKRLNKNIKWSYNKITNYEAGKKLAESFNEIKENDLNVIVYNFVDMLSHARSEMKVIKELADDEAAYRSLTVSWYEHSPLQSIIKRIAEAKTKLIITTDHGTIRVSNPVKVVGERNLNTNLRYKIGRGMSYKEKEVFQVRNPASIYLPGGALSSEFIFAKEDDFFVYPNNFNHFVNHYSDTFQHGGISLEELLIPFIVLQPK